MTKHVIDLTTTLCSRGCHHLKAMFLPMFDLKHFILFLEIYPLRILYFCVRSVAGWVGHLYSDVTHGFMPCGPLVLPEGTRKQTTEQIVDTLYPRVIMQLFSQRPLTAI